MISATVAVCAIVLDEMPYIEEWIAFHLISGVSRFLIFDNGSVDGTRAALGKMSKIWPLEVLDWPDTTSDFDHVQRSAYEFGAQKLAGQVDFVAFIDSDEFLYCKNFLPLNFRLTKVASDVGAIAINQTVFGANGQQKYSTDLVTSRFIRCAERDHDESYWYKTIARPEDIQRFESVHNVILKRGSYVMDDGHPLRVSKEHHGKANCIGSDEIRLNHYITRSLEEYRIKQKKWAGRDQADRFNDGYFFGRDTEHWGNARLADELKLQRTAVLAKIDELWKF